MASGMASGLQLAAELTDDEASGLAAEAKAEGSGGLVEQCFHI